MLVILDKKKFSFHPARYLTATENFYANHAAQVT